MSQFKILPHDPASRFVMPGFHTWCASMARSADGTCHLYASAWPAETGFDGWVTHSKIVHAISDHPLGPFEYRGVVLGRQEADVWDRDVAHNPTILQANGKWFLYYMGNFGNGEFWSHRNNQRVGVAVAERPEGPFIRSAQPLLPPGKEGAWDDLLTTNPSCTETADGRFLLIYKAVKRSGASPKFGPVQHGAAFAASPLGPFVRHPDPIFPHRDVAFAAEDPFVWCQQGKLFCMVKDMGRHFSGHERALVLFSSDDGIHWALEKDPVVVTRTINQTDGLHAEYDRLERPQLFFENGRPTVLHLAVKPAPDSDESYSIHLPVQFSPANF